MQGMHKMMRSLLAGMTGLLTECQRATSRLADLVDTAGFVMRIVDDQGKLLFEVLLVNTKATLAENYYDLPADMTVVDMNQKVEQALQKGQEIIQQVPDMDQMMQQNGSQVDEQTQHQMKQMMDQMQELQSQ
jgi:PII-like signaling protein